MRSFADRLDPNGSAALAGVRNGDTLVSINDRPVSCSAAIERQLYYSGVYSKATYSLLRGSVPLDVQVVLVPAERSMNDWLRLIALIYLGIGLYVLLRRWTAVGSLHFYIFCLVSFVFYSLHFTGKLNTFDWIVFWGNEVAWLLQPALFLHFVLTFPERRPFVGKHRWSIPALYVPGVVLLCIQVLTLQFFAASARLLWNLNRVHWAYLTVFFVSAAVVLWRNYRQAATPILRQQLKWIMRGTVLAITPFTLGYVLPYLFGYMPSPAMKVTVLSLGLLPLTFGYAIVRYRLMDVDLIFKRGMAYTLAAAAIAGGLFRGGSWDCRTCACTRAERRAAGADGRDRRHGAPVRSRSKMDSGKTRPVLLPDTLRLPAHAGGIWPRAELGDRSRQMLSSLVDRLSHTLMVDRIAIFLGNADHRALSFRNRLAWRGRRSGPWLPFEAPPGRYAGHIFFENTRQLPRETSAAQEAIAPRLELLHSVPRAQKQSRF